MKRNGIFLLALLLCAAIFLSAGVKAIQAGKDQVTVTETTLYGDPEAADGLQVDLNLMLERRLFWHTTYEAGAEPQPETEFTYYGTRRNEEETFRGSVHFGLGSLNVGFGSGFSMEDFEEMETGTGTWFFDHWEAYVAPILDLAPEVQPGETRTETVFLKDYYEYFRVGLEANITGVRFMEDQDALVYLNECLRIPVPEEMQIEVTITKDELGELDGVNMELVSLDLESPMGLDLYGDGFVTEDYVYLYLAREEIGLQDLTQLPLGYGIYRIPIVEARTEYSTSKTLNLYEITNVYPLDAASQSIRSVWLTEDHRELLVFTNEADGLLMTVVDRETMTVLQQLPLEGFDVPEIWHDGEFLVLSQQVEEQNRLLVYCRENGAYKLWLNTEQYPLTPEDRWTWDQEVCFDGTRLAIVNFWGTWNVASHRIAVYGRNGLLYAGDYAHNGDTLTDPLLTDWTDSLTIQWS